jgi:hypothetical protein
VSSRLLRRSAASLDHALVAVKATEDGKGLDGGTSAELLYPFIDPRAETAGVGRGAVS